MRALSIVAALALQFGVAGSFAQESSTTRSPPVAASPEMGFGAAATAGDPCRAESSVVLRCDDPAVTAPSEPSPASQARLKSRLDRRRTTPDSDPSSPAAVVIVAVRPVDPNQQRWQQFDEDVALAALPSCASAGSAAGLLAVPLIAIEAAEGACR